MDNKAILSVISDLQDLLDGKESVYSDLQILEICRNRLNSEILFFEEEE